jgi:hypothetical protein
MKTDAFNEFMYFSSASATGLEEKINKFLDENSGRIKIMKRTMTVVSWGKPGTWEPVIQMVIGYKKQKTAYREIVRVVNFESGIAANKCDDYSKAVISNGGEITDLLFSSYIPNFQYSYANCVLAVFLKTE